VILMQSRLGAAVAAAVAVIALTPVPAAASLYSRLLHVYQTTGSIPACEFTSAQLEGTLNSTDTYEAQYFADFTNAIRSALAQRAAGVCGPRPAAAAGSQAHEAPLRLGPVIAPTSSALPTPIALVAVLGGLFLLAGAIVGAARLTGWEPAWAAAWRHAWDEAEYRVGGTWLEFVDWLRSRD
jgi:hypothetical protein